MKSNFNNSQLKFDTEKHLNADQIEINKDQYHNGEENVWCIDINDDSYVYYNEAERDFEYANAKRLFTKMS